jgi:hypothetical protein
MSEQLILILDWFGQVIRENVKIMLSALFGTFVGAYLAFIFERRHTDNKERDLQISAAKRAQFAITAQLNVVINMKEQVLDPQRDDPQRHLTLKPFSVLTKLPSLNVDSLVFMLEDEGAQLLNELMISEHKFQTLLGALDQRNKRHELMQQQIAKSGHAAIDDATVAILKDMTDSIFGFCDDMLSDFPKSFEKLSAYIEKKFAGIKALTLDLDY